ncbi:uncharacterized protein METZ01_LOCUS165084, partial [marine metagenome]
KLMGLACFIFVILLSVSGILLMHNDSLGLSKRMVEGQFLPEKYFHVAGKHRAVQSLAFISKKKTTLIFAGTNHGLFRSDDGGQSWIELKQGLFSQNIRDLAVDPKDSQLIYAGTPKGIFKSENQGENWNEWFDQSSGLANTLINELLINPKNTSTVYAATEGGLFVTNDDGDLWESVKSGIPKNENVRTIRFSAAHPDQLIVGTNNGVFKSSDGGQIWEKKWNDLPPGVSGLATLNTDPEFIFIGTRKGFYKSFNGGLNWIKDKHRDLKEIITLTIDSLDQTSIYLSSRKGLFYSENSGDVWKEITPHKNNIDGKKEVVITSINTILPIVGSKAHKPILLAGSERGLFISENNGEIWKFINFGESGITVSKENFQMDLSKLITEVHTGRFFGSYFFWLVDLASFGMIALAISGLMIVFYRKKIKKAKALKRSISDEELEIDKIIDMSESMDNISLNSQYIEEMVEHVEKYLKKCRTIYDISQENEEKERINKHIATLDKKLKNLMFNIDDFTKLTQDIRSKNSFPHDTIRQQSQD